LNKKKKRKSTVTTNTTTNTKDVKIKTKRTSPVNLEDVLDNCEKTSKTKSSSKKSATKNKNSLENDKQNSNNKSKTNKSNSPTAKTQNFNISNTSPYIINQNNYFNAFNPNNYNNGCNLIDPTNNQRFYYTGNNQHVFPNTMNNNLDIPHPNKFFNPGEKLGYQFHPMAGRMNLDPQYMMNYQMMRVPPFYCYQKPSDFMNQGDNNIPKENKSQVGKNKK
jgi:hypothetical protein